MDIPKLIIELTANNHPITGVYDPDAEIATDQINEVNLTMPVKNLSGDTVFAATDTTEFAALTDHRQSMWVSFCSRVSIDPFRTANVAFVNFIFGDGSATLTALAALRIVPVSRSDQIGIGFVYPGHVETARL